VPIVCSVFADHQLRARMREIMKEREVGPQYAIDGLAVYLRRSNGWDVWPKL